MRRLIKISTALSAVLLIAGGLICGAQQKNVRVGLLYSSSAAEKSVKISSPTGFIAGEYSDGVFTPISELDENEAYVFLSQDSTALYFDVNTDNINKYSQEITTDEASEETIEQLVSDNQTETDMAEDLCKPISAAKDGNALFLMAKSSDSEIPYIEISGKKYPEILEFSIDSNNKIKIINIVSLEQYIKGVLPNEVYTSWEPEALKAAAVATRTYTLKSMRGKHASLGFDLCPTTDCQVYAGVTKTAQSTDKAVDDTKGQVLTYNGVLAETVYHAVSGGMTESAYGAWGGDKDAHPYLTVVSTPFEKYQSLSNGTWSHAISDEELFSLVDKRYPERLSGEITDIQYETDGGVYVHRMTVSDNSGNCVTLNTSSAVRSLFSKYALSANLTIGRTFIPSDEKQEQITVLTASGKQTVLSDSGCVYLTANSRKNLYGISSVWFLDGKGFGHGVGMSQYGAQYAALEGYTYDKILSTYYPGTVLTDNY